MNESIRNGLKRRSSLGKWNGRVMLGYDFDSGSLTVNRNESKIVKEIFELRSKMKSFKCIADCINSKGHKTKRGNLFSQNSIKSILKNPVYIGLTKYSKPTQIHECEERVNHQFMKGEHSAIIDREVWDRVQSLS
jgi:site-specific DNA recombinase